MKNNNDRNRKRPQSTPPKPTEPDPIPFTVPDLENFSSKPGQSGKPALIVYADWENDVEVEDLLLSEAELGKMKACAKRCGQTFRDWIWLALEEKMQRSHRVFGRIFGEKSFDLNQFAAKAEDWARFDLMSDEELSTYASDHEMEGFKARHHLWNKLHTIRPEN